MTVYKQSINGKMTERWRHILYFLNDYPQKFRKRKFAMVVPYCPGNVDG